MLPQLAEERAWLCYLVVLITGPLLLLLCQKVRTVCSCYHNYNHSSAACIPRGNQGLPFVGETLQFMAAISSSKGVYEFVRVRRLRFGTCFKTRLFGKTHVFVSSTQTAKAILNNEVGKFNKKYIRSIAELVGEDSLLCAAYHHHKLIRGRLLSLFSTSSLESFVRQFDELVVETLGKWEPQATVVIQNEALKITCRAMCKMLMSIEDEHRLETMQTQVAHLCEAMLAFPLRLPCTRFHRGLQARKRIINILEKEIKQRRSGATGVYEDFLQRLLAENDNKVNKDGTFTLTDREIQDNILTMIIAGQDTTASAITWMVKFLYENQDVFDTLQTEQFQIGQNGKTCTYLTLEDLNKMTYASKVVKESLRLASVVQWFPRLVLEDCEIEGFKIKKGWNINIDAKSIHLDPTVYNDPDKFDPSRFQAESKPYSFLPFGMGGRTCPGMTMAKAMMLVFLHRLITAYKWKVIDSDSSIEKWALFSKLRSGCPVNLTSIVDNANKTDQTNGLIATQMGI